MGINNEVEKKLEDVENNLLEALTRATKELSNEENLIVREAIHGRMLRISTMYLDNIMNEFPDYSLEEFENMGYSFVLGLEKATKNIAMILSEPHYNEDLAVRYSIILIWVKFMNLFSALNLDTMKYPEI